jgi:hypothetical protein
MTDGDERARESWAIYLVDGALAANGRSGGPHRYRSPDNVALFQEIARRALWQVPQGSKPSAMRQKSARAAAGQRRATMPIEKTQGRSRGRE